MDRCYECGVQSSSLKNVRYEGADSVVIVDQYLCETCYIEADTFTMLNDIEVVNVVKEV